MSDSVQLLTVKDLTANYYTFKGTTKEYNNKELVPYTMFDIAAAPITAYVITYNIYAEGDVFFAYNGPGYGNEVFDKVYQIFPYNQMTNDEQKQWGFYYNYDTEYPCPDELVIDGYKPFIMVTFGESTRNLLMMDYWGNIGSGNTAYYLPSYATGFLDNMRAYSNQYQANHFVGPVGHVFQINGYKLLIGTVTKDLTTSAGTVNFTGYLRIADPLNGYSPSTTCRFYRNYVVESSTMPNISFSINNKTNAISYAYNFDSIEFNVESESVNVDLHGVQRIIKSITITNPYFKLNQ